jgi:hypothetical protein
MKSTICLYFYNLYSHSSALLHVVNNEILFWDVIKYFRLGFIRHSRTLPDVVVAIRFFWRACRHRRNVVVGHRWILNCGCRTMLDVSDMVSDTVEFFQQGCSTLFEKSVVFIICVGKIRRLS